MLGAHYSTLTAPLQRSRYVLYIPCMLHADILRMIHLEEGPCLSRGYHTNRLVCLKTKIGLVNGGPRLGAVVIGNRIGGC